MTNTISYLNWIDCLFITECSHKLLSGPAPRFDRADVSHPVARRRVSEHVHQRPDSSFDDVRPVQFLHYCWLRVRQALQRQGTVQGTNPLVKF